MTVSAGSTQPSSRPWMTTLHQRDEVLPDHLSRRLDPERRERLRVGEPPAGGLRHLPVGREVVVAALGRDCLALQVARIVATPGGRDTRSGHHNHY